MRPRPASAVIRRACHVTVLLLAPVVATAQERLSLDDAVTLALAGNRPLQVATLEVKKKEAAVAAARTFRLPQFTVQAAGLQLMTQSAFTFPAGIFGVFPQIGPVPPIETDVPIRRRPGLLLFGAISQPLSQQYRIGLGLDLAATDVALARERVAQQQQTVVNDVRKAYYQLLQADSALAATRQAVTAFRELQRVAGEAVAQEAALRSDLLDAEAGLARLELDEVTLANSQATLRERLNGLLGRDELTEFAIVDIPAADLAEVDLAVARAQALERRSEIRQALLVQRQAELDRRVKKAEYIPDINASVVFLAPVNVDVLPTNIAGAGVTLSWDLFDWGRRRHELEAKRAVIDQARAGVAEARSQVLVEVGHLFRAFQEARARLRVAELTRDAAVEKVRVGTNRHEQQAIQLKDLLVLQAQSADAHYKFREALLGFWTARADFERATGGR